MLWLILLPVCFGADAVLESRRRRRAWQRSGPLGISRGSSSLSLPSSLGEPVGSLSVEVRGLTGGPSEARGMSPLSSSSSRAGVGLRLRDAFIALKIGRNVQQTDVLPGVRRTSTDSPVDFASAPIRFDLRSREFPILSLYLYNGSRGSPRLLAVGHTSVRAVLISGEWLVDVTLFSCKGQPVGQLGLVLRFSGSPLAFYSSLGMQRGPEADEVSSRRAEGRLDGAKEGGGEGASKREPLLIMSSETEFYVALPDERDFDDETADETEEGVEEAELAQDRCEGEVDEDSETESDGE
eukprot:TRINITY_DN38385_c0_g1_i1.p1 TRINITY_DN38385_c0_g1~~TRINITY_DN38385_c0_g1_i1.p1  ORF type:complete len:296 (-),score=52.82 TRINITY_DN38385_c0_g1_i1:1109-1996(-)